MTDNSPNHRPRFINFPPLEKQAFYGINDEAFEGDGDSLEEEEFERTRYYPFLDNKITGEVENCGEEEGDVELGEG